MPSTLALRTRRVSAGPIRGSIAVGSAAAGLIHAAVVPEHLSESLLFAAFFAALAVWQVRWAFEAIARPTRSVLRRGAAVNAAVVVLWAFSRTTGLPVGPERWTSERAGAPDLLATMLEVGLVIGALLAMALQERSQETPRAPVARAAMRTGVALAPLSVAALIASTVAGHGEGHQAIHHAISAGAAHAGHGSLPLYAILAAFCLFATHALLDAWANGRPRFSWEL